MVYVDKKIKEAYEFIENYFGDNSTSYVFTADHGMSSLGSHGDGNPENTKTPLVSWGAGVQKPQTLNPAMVDGDFASWNLGNLRSVDVEQADIAILMATLIGVELPVNSVGILPIDYLGKDEKFKTHALFTNTKQILEQYIVKESIKRREEIFFIPYHELNMDRHSYVDEVDLISKLIDQEKFTEAQTECHLLIDRVLRGLRYLQT